jgi:hypothetical protein
MGQLPRDQVPVLAPYFSAVVRHRQTNEVNYYTLGQAPTGGGTTLRAVMPDNSNCNLGPGPEPRLDAFLARLRDGEKSISSPKPSLQLICVDNRKVWHSGIRLQ